MFIKIKALCLVILNYLNINFVNNFTPSTLRVPGAIIIVIRHALATKKDSVSPAAVDHNAQVTCLLAIKAFKVVRLLLERTKHYIHVI